MAEDLIVLNTNWNECVWTVKLTILVYHRR